MLRRRVLAFVVLVLLLAGSLPAGRAVRWNVDVSIDPSQTKSNRTVDFTVTLHNAGTVTVTVCGVDIKYSWESGPHNVFTGMRDIVAGGSTSWITTDSIPLLPVGPYTATVNVTAMTLIDPLCNSSDWVLPIDIVPNMPPSAAFTYAPPIAKINGTVYFSDNSSDPDGSIVGWQWDFADGGNSSLRNPTHPFVFGGNYPVVLVVTDNDGSTNSASHVVSVVANLPPIAAFSYLPINPNTTTSIQFTDTSSDSDGSILTWSWDFGDNSTSKERNPMHRFLVATVYPVTLTVTDSNGSKASVTQNLQVTTLPNGGTPRNSGPGLLEWSLAGIALAAAAVAVGFLFKRRFWPARRWGQAHNQKKETDAKSRWRPR